MDVQSGGGVGGWGGGVWNCCPACIRKRCVALNVCNVAPVQSTKPNRYGHAHTHTHTHTHTRFTHIQIAHKLCPELVLNMHKQKFEDWVRKLAANQISQLEFRNEMCGDKGLHTVFVCVVCVYVCVYVFVYVGCGDKGLHTVCICVCMGVCMCVRICICRVWR